MADADRMGDLPTRESDIAHVEAKTVEEEEDEDEDGEVDKYSTLRKSSVFTLQLFSQQFGGEVFSKIQSSLQQMLESSNQSYCEAGIIALGAISDPDGSYEAVEQHLGNLVPFLLTQLASQNREIQATTCWTLSKFSEWIGTQE